MKVGDLVLCPPTLDCDASADIWELALVSTLYANEPKIGVVYLNEDNQTTKTVDVWYIHEIKLVSDG